MMYHLYVDGSEFSNPKRGGWGFVLIGLHKEVVNSGFRKDANINEMELLAVLKGLEAIEEPSFVIVYTDSLYVLSKSKDINHKHELEFIKVGYNNQYADHHRAHNLAREAVLSHE